MRALALLVVAAVGLAGCTTSDLIPDDADERPAIAADWAERAVPFGGGHDHFDPAQHRNLSTPNFEILGWDPLVTNATGETAGGHFCGEARESPDGRRLAVVNSFYSGFAFVLADVTDPARPVKLGELALPWETAYDVALTPDNRFVLVGANPKTSPSDLPVGAALPATEGLRFTSGCTGIERAVPSLDPLPHGPATLLVDIQDLYDPRIVDVLPAPALGPHSVATAQVGDRQLACISTTNLAHPGSYFQFLDVTDGALTLLGAYQAPPPASDAQPVVNGHVDCVLQEHPVTGQLLAYLADWDAGVVILDITDPLAPRQLSTFSTFTGGGGYMTGVETGNIHEAIPIEGLWDGRHYVLAGQEILSHPADHPTGWVWILDDTDPTDLTPVGRWTLPVEVEWEQSLQFSTHYVTVVDRTAFVSVYHAGVWALDLSTPESLALPPSVGVFIPANVSPHPPEVGGADVVGNPTVMEAYALPGGDLVVFDAQSGVYVVRFDATRPITPPAPWPTAALE